MKNKLYLHIGIGKTGTSAIQHMLFSQRRELEKLGWLYPDVGISDNAHHQLAYYDEQQIPRHVIQKVQDIKNEYQRGIYSHLLLSTEQFCYCKRTYIGDFIDLFDDFEIKIIFYVRNQIDLIKSAFMQKVRESSGGYYNDIDKFFNVTKYSFDFNERIHPWEEKLGAKNILVQLYDRRKNNFNVCDDFKNLLSLQMIKTDQLIHINTSLLPEFIKSIQVIDRANIENQFRKELISEFVNLSDLFRTCSYTDILNVQLSNYIIDYYKASNELFADKYLSKKDKKALLDVKI